MWTTERLIQGIIVLANRKLLEIQGDGFMLGCNLFGLMSRTLSSSCWNHNGRLGRYLSAVKSTFDFVTIPFYARMDDLGMESDRATMFDWAMDAKLLIKGHPLLWLYRDAMPKAEKRRTDGWQSRAIDRCRQYLEEWKGRIWAWDVVNELHGPPWGNCYNLGLAEMLNITVKMLNLARTHDPNAIRIVNFYNPWEGFSVSGCPHRIFPRDFALMLLDAGAPVDMFGLQCYIGMSGLSSPEEVYKWISQFSLLGVPLMISELAIPSSSGIDRDSDIGGPIGSAWSEDRQSDWIRELLNRFWCDKLIRGVSLWDIADYPSHFWPFGGLFDAKMSPKKAWDGLRRFAQQRYKSE